MNISPVFQSQRKKSVKKYDWNIVEISACYDVRTPDKQAGKKVKSELNKRNKKREAISLQVKTWNRANQRLKNKKYEERKRTKKRKKENIWL